MDMVESSWPREYTAESRDELVARAAAVRDGIESLLRSDGIEPARLLASLDTLLVPLASWVARRCKAGATLVLGLAGAQGTGKSTLAAVLQHVLECSYELRCARLSIDDLYRTRAEREALAHSVHPLLATRGVPGTHDVELGRELLAKLRAGRREIVQLPRFDKARDDRAPESEWSDVETPLDCVLFEGWCLGAWPEPDVALELPINALERECDPQAEGRRYANAMLAGPYRPLFDAVDVLVFLAAPDLDCSRDWRIEQEHKLRARAGPASRTMNDAELARFVQHYERISRHMLAEVPGRADAVLYLDRDHAFTHVAVRG